LTTQSLTSSCGFICPILPPLARRCSDRRQFPVLWWASILCNCHKFLATSGKKRSQSLQLWSEWRQLPKSLTYNCGNS
jgi:hypothetical protein